MRYLLIVIAVVQFLIGALWIGVVIKSGDHGLWNYLPGVLNVLAGIYGLRVGVKGTGHLGLAIFDGVILALVLTAYVGIYGSLKEVPWKDLDVILNAGLPAAAILLGMMVGKPRRED